MIKVAGSPVEESQELHSSAKRDLRARYRSLRANLADLSHISTLIQSHLADFLAKQQLDSLSDSLWASYVPMVGEVDLMPLTSREPKRWAYPVIYGESLQFFIPRSLSEMKPNRFGILEPSPERSQFVGVEELAGVLLPGLAFDRFGTRLGSGLGFYDRALETYTAIKIGVAAATQVCGEILPRTPHDVLMTHLATESGLMPRIEEG